MSAVCVSDMARRKDTRGPPCRCISWIKMFSCLRRIQFAPDSHRTVSLRSVRRCRCATVPRRNPKAPPILRRKLKIPLALPTWSFRIVPRATVDRGMNTIVIPKPPKVMVQKSDVGYMLRVRRAAGKKLPRCRCGRLERSARGDRRWDAGPSTRPRTVLVLWIEVNLIQECDKAPYLPGVHKPLHGCPLPPAAPYTWPVA